MFDNFSFSPGKPILLCHASRITTSWNMSWMSRVLHLSSFEHLGNGAIRAMRCSSSQALRKGCGAVPGDGQQHVRGRIIHPACFNRCTASHTHTCMGRMISAYPVNRLPGPHAFAWMMVNAQRWAEYPELFLVYASRQPSRSRGGASPERALCSGAGGRLATEGTQTLVERRLGMAHAADLLGCELGSPQVAQNQALERELNPPYQKLIAQAFLRGYRCHFQNYLSRFENYLSSLARVRKLDK